MLNFQVASKTCHLLCEDELHRLCCMLSKYSGYNFCPGLNKVVYEKYSSVLRYDSKSVRLMSESFYCVDSPQCELWHKPAKNSSILGRGIMPALQKDDKSFRSMCLSSD